MKLSLYILVFLLITACASTGSGRLPEHNVYGVENYIVDKYNLYLFPRGVYDVDRNDKVDVGYDLRNKESVNNTRK